jgi:hypothetical protein
MTTFDVCGGSPSDLLASTLCLDDVSKDVRGELIPVDAEVRDCRDPECRSLTAEHALSVELSSYGCDSELGRLLDGRLVSKDLVTVFVGGSGERRGMHGATFRWRTASALIDGRLSGMTNEGTHREPAFDPCQPCDARGVLEGRLCGRVVRAADPALAGAQVFAAYRLRFDPDERGGSGAVAGTLEGVVVRTCRTDRSCVDFDLVGDDANPRSVGGLTVETRDLNGPTPATSVVTWGAWTGLHLWHETEIVLAQPVARAEVTVVQFAMPPTARALDAGGATIATVSATAPQQVPETLVLTAPGITRLIVSSPQDEVLLLQVCLFAQ